MITFINRFTVHGPAEEFERAFDESSHFFTAQPGFVRHRLMRHHEDPTAYANLAEWEDEESFLNAVRHPEFAAHRAALQALATSDPNLYTPLYERTATT
ncbi:antibiotic biosynthesis monooxygenase family protein [Streptomyces sp. NPDC012888]|uniref:antibiotic biosynthesis monooxygenase family protein n=1 Tax=Streptomyces sp. NPDC012888 TaxID=3364855 RepID=UPI0036C60A03